MGAREDAKEGVRARLSDQGTLEPRDPEHAVWAVDCSSESSPSRARPSRPWPEPSVRQSGLLPRQWLRPRVPAGDVHLCRLGGPLFLPTSRAWLTCQAGVAVCARYLRFNLQAEATGALGRAGWLRAATTELDARRHQWVRVPGPPPGPRPQRAGPGPGGGASGGGPVAGPPGRGLLSRRAPSVRRERGQQVALRRLLKRAGGEARPGAWGRCSVRTDTMCTDNQDGEADTSGAELPGNAGGRADRTTNEFSIRAARLVRRSCDRLTAHGRRNIDSVSKLRLLRAALGAQPGQTEAPASPRDRRARAPGSCSNDSVLEEADASRLSTAPADSSPWKAITCFQPCRPCFLLRDEVPLTAGDRFGVGGAAGAPTKLVKGFGGRRAAGPGSRVVSGGRGGGRGVSRAIAACPASRPARDPAVPLPRPRRREHCRLLQMLGLGVTRRRPDAHKRRRPRHRRCCPKWPPALALKSNRRKLAATSLPLSVTWTCDPPPARRHHVVRDPGSPGAREAGDPRLLPAAVGGTPGESLAHT
ncbi:unnamed protein product [Rangifer tarandus platyrhynchus]|uniref:Uncharacterized protein n=1 Tax=Rangifer tarandus platyrhynchus TaxID=3082113 RepID=A0ABN8ZHW2_RANTA|nr:unnamed protein product [Rangifer tarandus platyrhynchus]